MTQNGSPMTAVIYARFSCSKQREASIEDQLRVCRDWCRREGYSVVAEYSDYAISGRTDDRPKFQEMIANAGESEIVLVYMMDRFSRDAFDAPIYKRELGKHGVRLVSALEAIPDSPEGIIYEKLLEGIAACESAKTSVRTKRGMEGNALKCKDNGVRVFGYRADADGHYQVVPDEAAMVREAYERRISGETCGSIAEDLAQRGVRTYTGRPCGYMMVYQMLQNEKYKGVYFFGSVRREGGMPRIVDDGTWDRAQHVHGKKRRAAESWGDFVLSGRVICSACGRTMPGVSGRSHNGLKYEYYGCKHCDMKAVRRDWLEGETVEAIRSILSDRDEALRIAQMVVDSRTDHVADDERKRATAALRSAESGMRNLLAAVEQGILVPGTKERIGQLEEQRTRALRDLESLDACKLDAEVFADFLQSGTLLDDRSLLDAFVYQALVSEEYVLVTLNYDTKKLEPARINLSRVLTDCAWLPGQDSNLRHAD